MNNNVEERLNKLEAENKKKNKQLGITLVALVITMIVMLILAAVTVAQLSGNGLFDRTKLAKEKYKNSEETQDSILSQYQEEIEKVGSTRDTQAPVGTVISCIRTTAPEGYLACDGTEYNISDYPNLAEEIKKVYNGYNTSTANKFKVPDLRGEFLRGTGTNSHTNQGNGEQKAGVHQDGTKQPELGINPITSSRMDWNINKCDYSSIEQRL